MIFYRSCKQVLVFISVICVALCMQAEEQKKIPSFKQDEMNGFKLSNFPDFEKKWNLITVRFRKDTGEMRFTYANPLAFEVISKGAIDYPDGAIFAKIGVKTDVDSAFPSSAVPEGARRFQFMVKDKKKFEGTEGWGYALFDKEGLIFPQDPQTQIMACAACHRLVPERGYVFSQLMELSAHKKNKSKTVKTHYTEKIKFKIVQVATLPDSVRKEIPDNYKDVQQMDHAIAQFLFQGTLDEVKPLLSTQTVLKKMPSLVLSKDKRSFALVFIENEKILCENEGKNGYFLKAVSTSGNENVPNYENRFCWTN